MKWCGNAKMMKNFLGGEEIEYNNWHEVVATRV